MTLGYGKLASGDQEVEMDQVPIKSTLSPWEVMGLMKAFTLRNYRLWARFKLSALFGIIGSIVGLATFFFLGRFMQPGISVYISQYGTGDFFPYVLLGMAFGSFAGIAMSFYLGFISS